MKRKNLVVVLFLAVAVVMTGIVFLVPAIAQLDGSTWNTDFDPITFSQNGSAVTGTYTPHREGQLTGTLVGQDLEGWWSENDDAQECGPGNLWSGPILFRFSNDWMSFEGDWGHCNQGIDDLDPDNPGRNWDGTLLITTTTAPAVTTTTTTPADTTTTTEWDCLPGTTACGDTCCDVDDEFCCGNHCCWDYDEFCCGDHCCKEEAECCGDVCCKEYERCVNDVCCKTSCGDECCGDGEICDEDTLKCEIEFCTFFEIYGKGSEEVELLRAFRDKVLSQSPVGQEIIELYYQLSPAIVKAVEADEAYKEEVKGMIDGVLELMGGVE
jgi:hypothetical protein